MSLTEIAQAVDGRLMPTTVPTDDKRAQFVGVPDGQQPPLANHGHARAELLGVGQVVRGEEYGHALIPHLIHFTVQPHLQPEAARAVLIKPKRELHRSVP